MLRARTRISREFFELKIASRLPVLCDFEYWTSSRINDFRENYRVIVSEEISFWFGFISNNEFYKGSNSKDNAKTKFNFTIEFNPNKVGDNKFLIYLFGLLYDSSVKQKIDWSIVSCDFACDIETNILNIGGINKGSKRCLLTFDNGGDNKTYYIGKGSNRVKIYNKRIESNLEDIDLTRIELTHCFKELSINDLIKTNNIKLAFPDLYYKEYQIYIEDLDLNSTFKAVLYAVNCGFPISDLSKYYKNKLMQYENEKEPIKLDSNSCLVSLKNTISHYFSLFL